ncbi:MAG TPA: hypothetical protein VE684_20430 [Crenalkalicoccus sp.]|jgi:hypothetical protein|nr:hypothetical protein [Crenalkalicoccus sp.]
MPRRRRALLLLLLLPLLGACDPRTVALLRARAAAEGTDRPPANGAGHWSGGG